MRWIYLWYVGNACSIDPMVCIAHVFNLPALVHVRCDCAENPEYLIYTAAVPRKSDRWTVCIQIRDAAVNPAKLLPLFKQSRGLRAANVCARANTNCIENRKSILINVRLKCCYINSVYYESNSLPLLIGADQYTGWSMQMTTQI